MRNSTKKNKFCFCLDALFKTHSAKSCMVFIIYVTRIWMNLWFLIILCNWTFADEKLHHDEPRLMCLWGQFYPPLSYLTSPFLTPSPPNAMSIFVIIKDLLCVYLCCVCSFAWGICGFCCLESQRIYQLLRIWVEACFYILQWFK